jgi:fructokinase
LRIGIDLGGTKIEGIALGRGGETLSRHRIATPRDDYEATLEAIVALVSRLEDEAGSPGTLGVGMPGVISPLTGRVKNANSTWLIGKPLGRDLEQALGREVRLANDADCFALSEAVDGAGMGARVVFGVIVGTGTGGGIVVDGRIVSGPNAIGGEWGHNPIPWPETGEWPGSRCYCGRSGCIETFLSGPGLARDFEIATGERIDGEAVSALADAGDEAARACLGRYERRMARALASIINVLDPDVIVLGGGLSKISRLYEEVPRLWGEFVFSPDPVMTRLVPPRHGDSGGVRGAAWLWPSFGDSNRNSHGRKPS